MLEVRFSSAYRMTSAVTGSTSSACSVSTNAGIRWSAASAGCTSARPRPRTLSGRFAGSSCAGVSVAVVIASPLQVEQQIVGLSVAGQTLPTCDRHGRGGELDHGRSVDRLAGAERSAVVDRRVRGPGVRLHHLPATGRLRGPRRPRPRGRHERPPRPAPRPERRTPRPPRTAPSRTRRTGARTRRRSRPATLHRSPPSIGPARSAPGPTGAAARRSASAPPA